MFDNDFVYFCPTPCKKHAKGKKRQAEAAIISMQYSGININKSLPINDLHTSKKQNIFHRTTISMLPHDENYLIARRLVPFRNAISTESSGD